MVQLIVRRTRPQLFIIQVSRLHTRPQPLGIQRGLHRIIQVGRLHTRPQPRIIQHARLQRHGLQHILLVIVRNGQLTNRPQPRIRLHGQLVKTLQPRGIQRFQLVIQLLPLQVETLQPLIIHHIRLQRRGLQHGAPVIVRNSQLVNRLQPRIRLHGQLVM